ncbi:MAG: hypothetical protein JW818_06990 [Pirellulales bacterium]|nr:hypothetical protein [Pirellulales bacterium]
MDRTTTRTVSFSHKYTRALLKVLFLPLLFFLLSSFSAAQSVEPERSRVSPANAFTPTRLALVTGLRSKDALDAMALAEAQLAALENVSLLERGAINRLLEEQSLALDGMSDPAMAIRVGKILTVDLLAVLEGDPKAKKQRAMGLVVFDARTGARLCDETLSAGGEKTAVGMAETVEAAVAKHRTAPGAKKTVSLVTTRNVDLPMEKDSYCEAIGRLLERALVRSPDVTLLERRSLEHIRRERAISPDAPANALLASLERIELEIAREGDAQLKATAILTSPDEKKRRVEATAGTNEAAELVDKLLAGILEKLSATAAKHKPDRGADALRMLTEMSHELKLRHYDRAVMLMEGCMTLATPGPSVKMIVANVYYQRAAHLYDPDNDPRRGRHAGGRCETFRQVEQTEANRKRVLTDAIRSVEFFTEFYEHAKTEGTLKELHHYKIMYNPTFYGYSMANLIHAMRRSSGGWNDENKQLMLVLMSRYEHVMLDVVLPYYAKQWQNPKWPYQYLEPYVIILANCWKYLPDSARWTDVMVEHGHRVAALLDRRGPMLTGCHNLKVTYVYPLSVIIVPQDNFFWRLTPDDDSRLKKLFDEMEQHRLPGMRAFGKLGQLWLGQATGRLSTEEIRKQSREVIEFAKKAVEKPGVKKADLERLACYEVICGVLNSTVMTNDERGRLLDEIWEFMVGRKEVALNILDLLACHYCFNHANYFSSVCFIYRDTWPRYLWVVHSYDRDVVKVVRLTRESLSLLEEGKLRCLDGRNRQTKMKLRQFLAEYAKLDPRFKNQQRLARDPWTDARRLLDTRDHPNLVALSKPAVRGDAVYVAGFFQEERNRVKLFHIPFEGKPTRIVGQVDLDPLPPGVPGIHGRWVIQGPPDRHVFDRCQYPLKLAPSTDDTLYYALPHFGGMLAFPLDGSPPQKIVESNTPGMPTNTIDYAAAVDGKIFALTSFGTTNKRSYVHWHDSGGDGWQVLASSARADARSPLDGPQHFFEGITYDVARRRVLFLANGDKTSGLYQFDVATLGLQRLKPTGRWRPTWYGRLPGERMWFTFAWGPLDVSTANIIQFDLKTNKWSEVVRWTNAPKSSQFIPGVKPSKRVIAHDRDVQAPLTEADGWIWSFHPLARVSFDGATYEQFKERLSPKPLFQDQLTPDVNTLEYLPERRGLLYGNHRSLWYFQLSQKPNPPPTRKKSSPTQEKSKAKGAKKERAGGKDNAASRKKAGR